MSLRLVILRRRPNVPCEGIGTGSPPVTGSTRSSTTRSTCSLWKPLLSLNRSATPFSGALSRAKVMDLKPIAPGAGDC